MSAAGLTTSEPEAPATDAGGVAARQGFKYQDHVAAHFVLAMIADQRLQRVECETADDIHLFWKDGDAEFSEYVQVKTTENDKKWSQAEITKRAMTKGNSPTSLVEKSLLCDKGRTGALFRIVSRRDVNKKLACLTLQRDSRQRVAGASELGSKLAKKWSTKSANGNDLAYWAKRVVWQIAGEMESLKAKNLQQLANLADRHGANPTHSHADSIYIDLLRMVDDAAHASRVKDPEKKVITRAKAIAWWATHLQETQATQQKTSKPYLIRGEAFFSKLYQLTEADIRRALTSYDARYEKKKWRSLQLADYLVDWLPEIALKASDLASVQHLQLRQKTRGAIRAIKQRRDLAADQLLAEVILHAVVREALGSEPIACKLFYQSATGLRSFGSAHIVHAEAGDELWLGRAAVARAASYNDVIDKVVAELAHVLDADFLKDERETILALREPQHLLPTTLEA